MADATTSGRPASLPGPQPPNHDWAAEAAGTIENVVGSVRDKTTGPALTAIRGVVYGTFAAVVGLAALVVLLIFAVRLLDAYLPSAVFGDEHVWAVYLILGVVFSVLGAVSWRLRDGRTGTRPSGHGEEHPA